MAIRQLQAFVIKCNQCGKEWEAFYAFTNSQETDLLEALNVLCSDCLRI